MGKTERVSMYGRKYSLRCLCGQNDEESGRERRVFGIFHGKDKETFFCIIFTYEICVKIIPKVEKSTTQVKNMCYNIVGKKRVGELCSEVKQMELKDFSSFCPNRMGQEKIYC